MAEAVPEDETEVQQGDENPHFTLVTRCSPKHVMGAAKFLNSVEKEKIKKYHFGAFLELTVESPGRRDLVRWLYENSSLEAGCIIIQIKPGVYLQLTPWVVNKILGVPIGGDMPPTYTMKQRNAEFNKLRSILGLLPQEDDEQAIDEHDVEDEENGDQVGEDGEGGKEKKSKKDVTIQHILDKLKELSDIEKNRVLSEQESELKLRLFFMIVIDSYLMPCSSSNLNEKAVMLTRNMDLITKFDWSRIVYEDLREAVPKWHAEKDKPPPKKPRKGPPTRTLHGCCMVPMVYYLDSVDYPKFKGKDLLPPRINKYTKKELMTISNKCKAKSSFDHAELPLKSRSRTCYESLLQLKSSAAEVAEVIPVDRSQRKTAALAQARRHVPRGTPLDTEIGSLLEGCNSRVEQIGVESLYSQHVLQKLDSSGQHAVLDFHDHSVAEDVFVKCFKPTGYMDSSAMSAQFMLWKFEWKAEKKPYIIVSEGNGNTLVLNLSDILKKELDGSIEGTSQVFVPIQDENHWFLLVIDIEEKCGWVLNSNPRRSVYYRAMGVFEAACNCLLEMGVQTSRWPLSFMRGLAVQEDDFDCGIHVLMYIDGFERKDIYGHDKEMVFMYRQKTAIELIYSKENRMRPNVGMAAGDSSSLVVSRSALESVQGEAVPTVGSALESVQGEAVPTAAEQQESTSESTSESFSGAEDTSHKRKAEKVSEFEKSAAKRTRGRARPTLEVARYTKAPGKISLKLYDLVCSEKYKEDEIISIGGISITAASMAEFISGGVLSSYILQAFTECLMYDEENGRKASIFLAPQDYEKDPDKFKENIAKTLPASFWPSYDMIFLPVLHGNDWIVYCASKRVSNAVSFREREHCAETRQGQRKSVMEVLQKAIHETYKKKQRFAERAVECPNYAEDLTDTPHKIGLLALHFMECFAGLPFEPCLEGYSTAVLEYLLFHGKNTSEFPKTCRDVLEDL